MLCAAQHNTQRITVRSRSGLAHSLAQVRRHSARFGARVRACVRARVRARARACARACVRARVRARVRACEEGVRAWLLTSEDELQPQNPLLRALVEPVATVLAGCTVRTHVTILAQPRVIRI